MARPIDQNAHQQRRLHIIGAAMEAFAASGFAGTTTAAICKRAGIGSGTFFHYFPTKLDVMLAILELGTAETADWFADHAGAEDGREVALDWLEWQCRESATSEVAGFVMAVAGIMTEPRVTDALAADDRAAKDGLQPWLTLGQQQGRVRTDLTAERLASWLLLLLNGYLDRVTTDRTFAEEGEIALMRHTAQVFLSPR